MSIDDLKKLDRKLFRLLKNYSNNHSHLIYRDEEGTLWFQIRLNGGFEGVTIEGKVDDTMFKNLEEVLDEMLSPKIKEKILQKKIEDRCVYSSENLQ